MNKSLFHKDVEKMARELGWEDPELFLKSYRKDVLSKSTLPHNRFLKYISKKNEHRDLMERRRREII